MGYDFISGQRNVFIGHRSKFIDHLFCSKLTLDTLEQDVKYVRTIKTPEWRQWRRSGVCIVNFEYITHLAIVNLEHVSDSWVWTIFFNRH